MKARILATAALLTLSLATGCAQRAPHMIAASGDRAMEQGDFALAEREYEEVVRQQPWNTHARLQYGKALLGVGKPREAREQLEQAYTNRPNDGEIISTLAEAMGQSGDVKEAIRLLSTIADERKTPTDWLRLGEFARRARDYDTAERALLSAARGDAGVSLAPQLALYHFYREVGRHEDALDRLAMALWVEPANTQVQSLIREAGQIPGPTFARQPLERVTGR